MPRAFIINIILLITINFLIKPFYIFAVETEAQNLVGLSEWGKYYELFTFCFLFGFVHDPGLLSYNTKTVAEQPKLLQFMFAPILGSKLLLGLGFVLSATIGFLLLGYETDWYRLMIMIGISQFLGSMYMLLRSDIAGMGRYRLDSFLSTFDKLLMIIIIGSMVYLPYFRNDFTIFHLAIGQCISLLISVIVAYTIVTKDIKDRLPAFSMMYLKNMLRQALPYGILIITMTMYTKIDGIMLGRMIEDNNQEVGIYGACYRIIDAMNMVGNIVGALLVSMFARLLGEKKSITPLLDTAVRIIIFIAISAFVVIGSNRAELLSLLYDDYTPYFSSVLLVLLGGFVCLSIAYIIGALLTANGNVKSMNKIFVIGILLNILLNAFLIPKYQAYGAAIATLITEAIMLVGLVWIMNKIIPHSINKKLYIHTIIFIALAANIWAGLSYIDTSLEIRFGLGTLIMLVAGLAIINPKRLLELIEERKD